MDYEPPLRRYDDNTDLADLKPAPGAAYHGLDPNIRYLWFIGRAIFWSILVAIGLIVVLATGVLEVLRDLHTLLPPVILSILGLFVCLNVFWPFLSFRFWGYAWRRTDFLIRHGFIWKRVVAIPFARIQHVDSQSGPLERLFGMANLKIHTAGSQLGAMRVPGLPAARAEELRDRLSEVGHTHANI